MVRCKEWIAYSTLLAVALPIHGFGGLSLSKPCGDRHCQLDQYCSDNLCHNCKTVCNDATHNYDPIVCEEKCQDYIHDTVRHYLTEADSLKATKDLQDTIEGLRLLVALSITLSCIFGLGLLALVGYLILNNRRKYKHKKNLDKKMLEKKISSVSAIFNNNKEVEKDKSSTGLRLEMSSAVAAAGAPSVVTTTTPISTRHPSEDTTLEYAAYDNPNLTPSPQPQNRTADQPTQIRHETSF